MREVHPRLHVGAEPDCFREESEGWAVIHACKDPCHRAAVGYSGRSLPNTHPHYLIREEGSHLYMNLIDPDKPLFKPESFERFIGFASARYEEGMEILIHCNQGQSRSPSLALLFLAKELREISNESYRSARSDYEKLDPLYDPGLGIQTFMTGEWDLL